MSGDKSATPNIPATPEDAGAGVPAGQKGSWTAFIKAIASFSGDLSSLTAPPFILSPISLTEFPAYWCERPELFSAIANAPGPEERSLAVLKWFIGTLKDQYTSRNESMGSEKKPLNPVLGEVFYGYWPDKDGRGQTDLVVEQVSHHPPITAYHIVNKTKGLTLTGHSAQKTSFSAGSIIVKQIGHAVLTVALPGGKEEKYLITLPKLRIDGIWYGSPYIELTDTSYIQSSTGWTSTVEYKGRGYFSGKTHQFKASVAKSGAWSATHTIDGLWHTASKFSTGQGFHDISTQPKEEVVVAPLETQDEWESRKLWRAVAKGIRDGDFDTASKEKTKIENDQRQRRRDETAAGNKWELKHFKHIDSDPLYEKLVKQFKGTPPTEDFYEFLGNAPALGPAA